VDFYLNRRRHVNATKTFLRQAMMNQRVPTKITLDAYAASHRAVADLKHSGELAKRVRSCKYPNMHRGAGSSKSGVMAGSHSGAEELSQCSGDHRRHGTGRRDQEGSVPKSWLGELRGCQKSGKPPWLHNLHGSSKTGTVPTTSSCTPRAARAPAIGWRTKSC
jgi:hypothetical protein